MKMQNALAVSIGLIVFAGASPSFAADPTATRADQVASIQAQYNPLFDSQYARLLVLKKKTLYDATNFPIVKSVLADFLGARNSINTDLTSATADLETVRAYAEEETGEFGNTIYQLETQVAKNKTIRCVKGKVLKKVTAINPKCPSSYKQKKS